MIWPAQIGQPKRREHWDVFFEAVVDKDNKPIPSIFVIVIFIAACAGGVFTEEPECHEMVKKQGKKMSFITWKKRMLLPGQPCCREELRRSIQRIKWSSSKAVADLIYKNTICKNTIKPEIYQVIQKLPDRDWLRRFILSIKTKYQKHTQ